MKVSCEAFVDGPIEKVWRALADVDGLLDALPRQTLRREGDSASGSLKCILGSHQVTYRIAVRCDADSPGLHTAVLAVSGKEARGSGVLAASVAVKARPTGSGTTIEVRADLEVSGRGETADRETWAKVLQPLLDAAVRPRAGVAEPPHRAALPAPGAVPVDGAGLSVRRVRLSRQLAIVTATVVVIVLVRWRRRTRW